MAALIPPVLTCLIGRHLGSGPDPLEHFTLRDLAASIIGMIAKKYSHSSHTLKPRLARSFLKNFLDPGKPFGTHYGAIIGLHAVGGSDVVRELIVPNLKTYEMLLRDAGTDEGIRKMEAEKVIGVILAVLTFCQDERIPLTNGYSAAAAEELQSQLAEKVGELNASRILESGQMRMACAILGNR